MEAGKLAEYLEIATELHYSSTCIFRLNKAKTEIEAENILHDARLGLI